MRLGAIDSFLLDRMVLSSACWDALSTTIHETPIPKNNVITTLLAPILLSTILKKMNNCFLEKNAPSRPCCNNHSISWLDCHHRLVAQHQAAGGSTRSTRRGNAGTEACHHEHDNMGAQTPTPLRCCHLPRHRTNPNFSPTILAS